MTNSRGVLSLATAVLLLVAGTSCANDDGDPTDPRSNPPASSPSSSSPTSTSPSESATAAATATVNDYYAIRNQLRRDPTQPLSMLKSVTISTELMTQQTLFKRERKQGLHQTGETKVVELQVQSVNLDNSDPQAGKVPTVQIDVCFDVSGVDVLDADGKSVVTPDRPDTGWIRYSVANYQWDSDPDGAWRIASSQDIERTPCDA
ncbi:hypothetical protein [Nocardioides sp.]|uniref:hypothetical protein n=1 Tax=Nocardioides sp. TaxID=35761 RepID=UPI002634CED6|nr:hypothetical protein [Nocardioides sp.]MDI6910433.1 hypothetical protein [Nocardioides sp.]